MVSDVTFASALGQQQGTAGATSALAEDFSQFLTLLTVQLQNQDPLSPIESTEFTNQLVAFTGVEQQINSNQRLDSLIALNLGTAFSESQSYVGNEISYVSNEFEHTGAPSNVRYSLSNEAVTSNIFVFNQFGEIVYEEDGQTAAGIHEFVWDGTLSSGGIAVPGTYEVRIDALDSQENPVQTSTVVSGIVRGTESQNGQIFLLVGERAVSLSNILNTSAPTTENVGDSLTAALSYVGLDVSYLNTELNYDGSTPEDVLYTLDTDADRASIIIRDENGQTVFSDTVQNQSGQHLYRWDGRLNDGSTAPPGTYQFTIDAIDENDRRISTSSVAQGNVNGVETQNGQIFLNIGGTSVNLNNVISANIPTTTI